MPLAIAAALFFASTPAAHAELPPIATIGLTPGWITFGQAVPQGAASAALKIGAIETQTDVKNRWPDGSIRFAVLTANVPAAGVYSIVAAPIAAGAPLLPVSPATSATFTIGGVSYTATLPSTPSSDRWLSGHLAYEGRSIVAPVSSADGSPHAFLRVMFDTRVYADGNGRVDVTVENVLDQVGASTVTYDVVIAMNGAPVFSKAGVEHYYLTRWRKVFELGTGPRASITPDMTPFNISRALPPYLPLVGTQVDLIPADGSYDILRSGALDPNMPAHGGNPDLAPFPDWAARYLAHKDLAQRAFVLANGDLSGSWPVHVREPEGAAFSGVGPERFISLAQRFTVWYDERAEGDFMDDGVTLPKGFTVDGMPVPVTDSTPLDYIKGTPLPIHEYGTTDPGPGQSPLIPDNAHQPSLAYVPYLLTGDRYYAEEMAFWANYGMLRTRPSDGVRGEGGVLANNEVRGYGWALRNLADAAAYYPGDEVRQYLSQKVEANLEFLDAYANSQDPILNPQRILWLGYRPEPGFVSLWEQTYLAYAIDRANKQGFTGGLAHRDAIAMLQLRLFTSPSEFPREAPAGTTWSAPYLIGVGTVPDLTSWDGFSYYTTMSEFFSATSNVTTAPVCFFNEEQVPGCLQRDFAGFYGPEARLNLMMLMDSGVTAAKEPYDYLLPFLADNDSYCSAAYGGNDSADRSDLTCRSGWALDFYPQAPVVTSVICAAGSYLATPTDAACTLAPAGSFVAPGATSPTFCAAGTYSDAAGASACTPAPAGSFVSDAGSTSAVLCAAGTYSSIPGAIACIAAPAGSFVGTTGATFAAPCPVGTFSALPGEATCQLAPMGSFVSTPAATFATLCAAGGYSNVAGAIACTPAPAGSFVSGIGATSAALCAAGTYSSVAGAIACTPAPAGSFVSSPGATSSTLCPAGTYSAAGAIACMGAPAGSYVAPGATSPTFCPAGTYSNVPNATACVPAPAGSFVSTIGATVATLCPAGKYSDLPSAIACIPAPAGSFVSSIGAASATKCAAGSYSDVIGAISCTLAPAGSFVSTVGAITATLCPAGTYSLVGATACIDAPAGSFVAPGATTATLCPVGTFSSASGASACTPAPAGSFVNTTGATSATPAPAGSFVSTIGATVATLCEIGKYSDAPGAIRCTPAPAGSFVGLPGAISATPCAAGTYSDVTGANACIAAPAGSSVGAIGASSATKCAAGSYSDTTAATSCTLAPAGSFVGGIGATSATFCAPGTFSAQPGAAVCTQAPAGSFVSTVGAISATSCPAGTYSLGGAISCIDAPAGSFVAPGATTASPCPVGTFSSVIGASACTPAPAGSFVSSIGATVGTLCPIGKYSDVVGAIACTPAPAGSFVGSPGATSATLCAAGTYSSLVGANACLAAPAGSFVAAAGGTVSTPCPVGTFSPQSGAAACTQAPAGSFVGVPGGTSATLCPVGKFSDLSGAAACTPAPAGSFVGTIGATTAAPCALGTFSASTGAGACVPAPAGSFVSTTGAAFSALCAAGTYSNAPGAIACLPAPAGSFVGAPGGTSATLCPVGRFSDLPGAATCSAAPAGSYVSATGATTATLCAPGSYSAAPGAAACTLAPAGSFVSGAGAIASTPCPAGTTSSVGSTTCTAIGDGGVNPLSRFVAFSNDMTWLRAQSTVVTGDVGANNRAKHRHGDDEDNDGDGDDVTVRIGEQVTLQQPGSRVVGDTVRLSDKASVYNIVDNFLINRPKKTTIRGTITTSMSIPFLTLPTLPSVTPGTAAINVAKDATRTLGPGAYGNVHVSARGTLILTPGVYHMISLDVDQAATVIYRGVTELRIKDELDTANKAKIIADPSAVGVKASNLVIYVAGSNDRCGHDGGDDESGDRGGHTVAHIGENNVLAANIYAPNGTIWIKSKTQATGAFVGDDVWIGHNVTLSLDSAFR